MSSAGTGRLPISAFCVWEIPDRGMAVHLHLSAVEWLDYEIRESLRNSRAPEGAEVGGLLLGRIESKAWNKVTIEGFTPVSCEYESGSLYHLSKSDKDLLQEQLFRWERSRGRNLYVVGFYRSHNREDFSLDGEDVSLAKELFSDSAGVFLLIKPVGQRERVGGLFLCDEGHVERECNLIFPFSRSRLTRGETTLDSLPETDEQDRPEGVAPPFFAPDEGELEPEAFAPKPSPRRAPPPSEETKFEPEPSPPRPSARRGLQPSDEGELEPEAFAPKPSPRRAPPPSEEIKFEPEASPPRPSARRGHQPSKGKEFDRESYALRPAPRRSHFPPEEKELEPEELLPQAANQSELEFLPSQVSVFGPIESETPRWRSWAGMLLAAVLILGVGVASYQILRESEMGQALAGLLSSLGMTKPKAAPLQPAALGLEALLEGETLRVIWNKDLPAIATAKKGSLSISDGGAPERNVSLGANQLQTGSVLLAHDTNQVAVRFQVIGANGETVESTPAIGVVNTAVARSGEPVAESKDRIRATKNDRSPPSSVRGSGTRARTERSRRNEKPEAARPSQLSLARATPPLTSPATSERSSLPPPPVSSPGAVEQKPAEAGTQRAEPQRPQTAAPELVKPAAPPAGTAAPLPSETTQRPPGEPPPKVTEPSRQPDRTAQEQPPPVSSREPAKPVTLPEKVPAPPGGAPPAAQPAPVTRTDYIPPRPVRQVKPSTPSNVRQLISEDVQINVKVEIDATGRVVRAEPVSKEKQDFLTALAVEAARQWRFSPARQGSQNVSSSAVVGFQFKKD
jgi:periplasmic protein TonB